MPERSPTDTLSAMLDTFGPLVTRKYSVTVPWLSMLSLFLNRDQPTWTRR